MRLPDTSAVVDIDRGGGGVDRKVRKLDDQARHLLSMVTVTKLRLGVELQYETGTEARENAMDQLDRLLARFDIQPISRSIATTAELIATLRERGQRLNDLHDIYIGATTQTEQRPVIIANVDDFERMDGVQVTDWEQL